MGRTLGTTRAHISHLPNGRHHGNRPDGDYAWSPATAKGVLELVGREQGMFVDRKIIGIKRLDEMGDDELRLIAGQVIEELDAQVSEDGEVRQVEAELLEPVPSE